MLLPDRPVPVDTEGPNPEERQEDVKIRTEEILDRIDEAEDETRQWLQQHGWSADDQLEAEEQEYLGGFQIRRAARASTWGATNDEAVVEDSSAAAEAESSR